LSTLIIISTPPTIDLEALELVLALAAFDQAPSLLLLGSGLHYANQLQEAKKLSGKSPAKVMSALPIYDCENIYIRRSDIGAQGLAEEDLHDFCQFVDNEEIQSIIKQSNHCVNF
jgi:tRNA 2-thiouridine synthesizing protein C